MSKINQPLLVSLLLGGLLILFFAAGILWRLMSPAWTSTILPGVLVDGIEIGGLQPDQALQTLEERRSQDLPSEIVLVSDEVFVITPMEGWELSRDITTAVEVAARVGREGSVREQLLHRFLLIHQQKRIGTTIQVGNPDAVFSWMQSSEQVVNGAVKPASAAVVGTGSNRSIEIYPGDEAEVLDQEALQTSLQAALDRYAKLPNASSIHIYPPKRTQVPLSAEQLEIAQERASRFLGIQVELYTYDEQHSILSDQELLELLSHPEGYNEVAISRLAARLNQEISREPTEPSIEIENEKIIAFEPPQNGLRLNQNSTEAAIRLLLLQIEQEDPEARTSTRYQANLPVEEISPTQKLEELNPYGIRERLGVGESFYRGSIPNRRFNIDLTSDRIQYTLIPPGQEYSFNGSVGEISSRTGYRSAYIIQAGRTVLGDGGGVCQVSTTVFRAALDAGMPISMRRGHSYRVGYYEQEAPLGLDATVYSPSVDFRFQNDTEEHLLLVTTNNPETSYLKIELWGTNDGRVASVHDFKTWGHVPAKPPVYVDDPNLPAGRVQQIDWAAAGARASFAYTVTRDDEVLQDRVFSTVYQPWASVYLRGTGGQ